MAAEVNTKQPQVTPGLCPPEGCPPPTRIECIVVDKVYDSCFQVDERTRSTVISTCNGDGFTTGPFYVGQVIPCSLIPGYKISCEELKKTPVNDSGFFNINLLVRVPVRLKNPNNPNEVVHRDFTFTKLVTLCCPEGTEIDCGESSLLFCNCVISDVGEDSITVTCDFQICLVIKCILTVQLLVPSYGFCVPAPCVTLPGVCPPTPPAQCF